MKNLFLLIFFALPILAQGQIITTVSGTGAPGCAGDGGPASAAVVGQLYAVATDTAGNIYLSCSNCAKVRKINTAGIITDFAGNGGDSSSGDGGQATAAAIGGPWGIATDRMGNVYIADNTNSVIRKVDASGIISTIAGDASVIGGGYTGDGGPSVGALLSAPSGLATDTSGNLYIADANNNAVRKISTAGIITRVAGNGLFAFSGDGGPALAAGVQYPVGVATDRLGNLYIVDEDNARIRKVDASGIITTVAGNGSIGFTGDGHAATAASLNLPQAVAVNSKGELFIADMHNNAVRKVDTSGIITRYAGTGTAGHSGDGGVSWMAEMYQPVGVACDKNGYVYIAELAGEYLRRTDTCLAPHIAPISGSTLVCPGSSITLTDTFSGGAWSVNDTTRATISGAGLLHGIRRGVVTVSYTQANSCATLRDTMRVSVGAYAGMLTGLGGRMGATVDTFCYFASLSTDGTPGGTWGLTNNTIAHMPGMFGPGSIAAAAYGLVDTAFYVVTDSCGTDTAFLPFMIQWCPDLASHVVAVAKVVLVYPNPVQDELHLSATEALGHVDIVTMTGRMVRSVNCPTNEALIAVGDLPAGLYLVKVGDVVRKFVKE